MFRKKIIDPLSADGPRLLSAAASLLLMMMSLPPGLVGQPSEEFLGLPPASKQIDSSKKFAGLSPEERKDLQEMMLVERFLSLQPDRLTEVRKSIELIQKMSPAEKERIRQQIRKFRGMPRGERDKLHAKWSAVSHERRNMMRNRFLSMSEEDRRAERDKLKNMTHEERRHYFRKNYGKIGDIPKMPPPPPPPPLYNLSVSEPLSTVGDTDAHSDNEEPESTSAESPAAVDADAEKEDE